MKKRIFISYKREDENIARNLKKNFELYKYEALVDTDKSSGGGDWRKEMMDALKSADVLVTVYTQEAVRSQFMPVEIGMARAFREMGKKIIIIPLIIAIDIPPFLSDLNLISIKSSSPKDLKDAAKRINESIIKQVSLQPIYPRIFISHRHKHEKVVQAIVDVLESAFNINPEDMRCTSISPYKLPLGAQTSERLKSELNNAEVVLGIISPDVDESQYTLFELGASWGKNTSTFPLLISGATPQDVPGPLSEKNCISLSSEENCWQLITELKKNTSLEYRSENDSKIRRELKALADMCDKPLAEVTTNKTSVKNNYLADLKVIKTYLESQDLKIMTLETLQKLYPKYVSSYVDKIIEAHPEKIRKGTLKGKVGVRIL